MEDFFDRWAWLYALCRERLFTDHTELVARIMDERFGLVERPVFLEVGCGPGFYSIAMAQRFARWQVVGIDSSKQLLKRAEGKASAKSIGNCSFCLGDATCASDFPVQADLVLASRLLFIVSDRMAALRAMRDGLRPGGTLLIAEPLPGWRSAVALRAMKVLRLLGSRPSRKECAYPDSQALDAGELAVLVERLDWSGIETWSDRRYQYFLCKKSAAKLVDNEQNPKGTSPGEPDRAQEARDLASRALIAS